MVEEIDVSEVVEAIDRVRANYRKPLIRQAEKEKPRNLAAPKPEPGVHEDRKPA